ncbi:glycosyltransferase [Draconibacterium halophilum]|uniref:Glycosyltransferase n=1 Tax=Draconibacterium halophilum TaxID=2706887 RepID=A0A6C0RB90_9BACT|nr:glycosyltransferase [Draconibacterium halophilum]QIA07286.1 glycosyltransferase [Draconibacterium halophilum]
MIQILLDTFNALTATQLVVLIIAALLWLLRLLYLLFFPLRMLVKINKASVATGKAPLSVLMVVRNEEENCRETLPRMLSLKKTDMEVVVVDDFSQDNTLSVLGVLKQRYQKLKISSLSQETRHSEKLSQNIALKSAEKDWVLVYPVSAQSPSQDWLDEMDKLTPEQVLFKVAYTTVEGNKNWFNKLYRIENFFQQVRSASYSLNGLAFIYNEENVAFKKAEYFKRGGYGAKIQEPYANLELVINPFIRKKHVEFCLKEKSILQKQVAVGRLEFKDLVRKSIRIERHLNNLKRFVLLADRLTQTLYPLLIALLLLVVFQLWPVVVAFVVVHALVFMVIIKMLQNRLNESKLFITSLVFSFIMPFYKLFFRWHFNRQNQIHKWKKKV